MEKKNLFRLAEQAWTKCGSTRGMTRKRNNYISVNGIWGENFTFKLGSWVRKHFVQPWAENYVKIYTPTTFSGVARAFPGGRTAHREDQIEEENEEILRKNEKTYRRMRKDWGNVIILPTREWEAGYGPNNFTDIYSFIRVNAFVALQYLKVIMLKNNVFFRVLSKQIW